MEVSKRQQIQYLQELKYKCDKCQSEQVIFQIETENGYKHICQNCQEEYILIKKYPSLEIHTYTNQYLIHPYVKV